MICYSMEDLLKENVAVKTANKDIGQLSRTLKDVSIRRRLKIPAIFKGLRLRGETERSRVPFETEFIQNKLLATGALDGLNEDARHVVYVVAETACGSRRSSTFRRTRSTLMQRFRM